jgi:hypothetical protein
MNFAVLNLPILVLVKTPDIVACPTVLSAQIVSLDPAGGTERLKKNRSLA